MFTSPWFLQTGKQMCVNVMTFAHEVPFCNSDNDIICVCVVLDYLLNCWYQRGFSVGTHKRRVHNHYNHCFVSDRGRKRLRRRKRAFYPNQSR